MKYSSYDTAKIKEYFSKISHDSLNISSDGFFNRLVWKIYEEWRIDNPKGDAYLGEGLSEFVADETHYALERGGFTWSDGGFIGLDTTNTRKYWNVRDRVLEALVKRSIDFFRESDKHRFRRFFKKDSKNLRCSLEPWID